MSAQPSVFGQEAQERACAQRFLDWTGSQGGASYALQRTEQVLPDLEGQLRWDFIARDRTSPGWIGIEVKRIPFLGLSQPLSDWTKLIGEVSDAMQTGFKGVIKVHFPPPLAMNQQHRKELAPSIYRKRAGPPQWR